MSESASLTFAVGAISTAFILAAFIQMGRTNEQRKDRMPYHRREVMRRPYTIYSPIVDVVTVPTPVSIVNPYGRFDRRSAFLRRSLGRAPPTAMGNVGVTQPSAKSVLGRPTGAIRPVTDVTEAVLHPFMHNRIAMQPILGARPQGRKPLTSTEPIYSHVGNDIQYNHPRDPERIYKR